MSDIFLSYKSEDRPRAKIIAEALEQHGYSVWWDRIIPPGKTFDQVIEEALDSAKCVIVLWSKESVLSDWVKNEVREGTRRHILVPVLIDDVKIPFEFRHIQAARLIDWQEGVHNAEFDLLLNSVAEIVGPTQNTETKNLSTNEPDISAQQPREEAKRSKPERKHREKKEIKEKEEIERLKKQREEQEKEELKAGEGKEQIPYKKFLIVIGILGIIIVGYLIYSAQSRGSISVNSVPSGASIYLDGNYMGTTPMIIESVIADSHNIILKLTGYQDLSQIVRVFTGNIANVSLSLIPISSSSVITPAERTLPYEIRGTVWNEYPIAGSVGGNGKTATWDASNFAGFYYDLDNNMGKESLQLLQTNLAASQRTIGKDMLVYTKAIDTPANFKVGDIYWVFRVVFIDTIGKKTLLRNTDSTISLSRDSTVTLMDDLKFRVADSERLWFMPVEVFTKAGSYETRGTVWNELPIAGSIGGNGKTATWDSSNFAGFYYDLDNNPGKESLQVLQTNLAVNQRTVDKDMIVYTTTAEARRLKVVIAKFGNDASAASSAGLARTGAGQALEGGNYYIAGWNSDRYVAINGMIDKLSKLVIEQGRSSSEKKTLATGESWDIGGGWTLTTNSIDARASPRQVSLMLSKDGVNKDYKVINQNNIYTYVEKSLAGETDVPVFVTYIDSIFAGPATDMVQLRYTWAIDTSVNQLKIGDTYGVFKVVSRDATGKKIELRNTDSTISLSQGSTVGLMGSLGFKVADMTDELRFMPIVKYNFK